MYFNYLLLILFFVNPILVLASPPETASATPLDPITDPLVDRFLKIRNSIRKSYRFNIDHFFFSVDYHSLYIFNKEGEDIRDDLNSSLEEKSEEIKEQFISCLNKEGFIDLKDPPSRHRHELYLKVTMDNEYYITPNTDRFKRFKLDEYDDLDRISEKCLISVFRKFFFSYKNEIRDSFTIAISLTISTTLN